MTDWKRRGACHNRPDLTDLFYPAEDQRGRTDGWDQTISAPAKEICATCTVVEECLDYSLTHEVYGVWGGKSERERRRIRKRFGIACITPRIDLVVPQPRREVVA
jgi:hypothetical protein